MNRSLIISSVLHALLIFITAMSLPFLAKKPLDIPPIVSVELIQIAEKTNIPFAPKAKKIIEKGFTFLATVGSTAPFIGLFGTVWGIMNSFQSIAISRNTSLAIVAPGIAEALFATALGLLAAIPAVVAYNKFNNDAKKYSEKLENFSKRFLTII